MIIYNDKKVKLCQQCAYVTPKVKDMRLLEYLDCSICCEEVKYESSFCNLCQHWIHPKCSNLNEYDLKQINQDWYGDWFCLSCTKTIFPNILISNGETQCNLNLNNENYFKNYLDCSICKKIVKGESICCDLCKHWVHKRCIGKFTNKRNGKIQADSILLKEVCYDVKIEPELIPLTTEDLDAQANQADRARLDISARGL